MNPPAAASRRFAPALAAACLIAAIAPPATAATPARGELLSTTKVAGLSPQAVKRTVGAWTEEGLHLDTRAARQGITAYRLRYRTVAPDGVTPTTASGLIVIPRNRAGRRRTLIWEHGTTVYKHDAPSTGSDADGRLVAYLAAASGFVSMAPDALGLGRGPGRHPYNDRPAEVSAAVDMVRASQRFLVAKGVRTQPNVYVAGFSQGGKDAMAVGQALQTGAVPGLGVAAQAGIGGVYDLEGAQLPAYLGHARRRLDPIGESFSLAYTAVSWKHRYGLYRHSSEVFRRGVGPKMERLFDGHHTQAQIFQALAPPRTLFTARFLARVAHPSGAFLTGIRNSDGACRYAPTAPTRLYAAHADEQVSFLNSQHCQRDFRALGARVPLVDVGKHGHFGSELITVPAVIHWFAGMR